MRGRWTRSLVLSSSLTLAACAGELSEAPHGLTTAPLVGELAEVLPAAAPAEADAKPRRSRRRGDRGPSNPGFALAHFGGGVASTLVIQTLTYSIALAVGRSGQGLGPVIGALAIGAFAPPIINYTVAWTVGQTVAPRRDRFWPGFLVRQVVHLGVFVGAVMGGADFNKPGHLAAIVVGEAFVNSGLATMTAELARRPLAHPSSARMHPGPRPIEIVVPVLEVKF